MCLRTGRDGGNDYNKLRNSTPFMIETSKRMYIKATIFVAIAASLQLVSSQNITSNITTSNPISTHSSQQIKTLSLPKHSASLLSQNTTNNNDKNNKTKVTEYGGQQEASILRPLILRRLLNAKRVAAPAEEEQASNEETEEVTQTIMMPMKEGTKVEQVSGEEENSVSGSSETETPEIASTSETEDSTPILATANSTSLGEIQLKPEASIQLSNTEISNLLNDGEAPDIYKERELMGHGVVVGEERGQHLEARGSSFGSRNLGGSSNGFGEPGSVDYRLAHAASGDFDGHHHGGFSHRFGHSGFDDGRLAQSPSEFGMHNNYGGHSSGYSGGYGSFSGYSPHSGLVQAGSGDYLHHNYGHGSDGFSHSGYMGSPRLEQHSSEIYGPSSHFGGGYGSGSHYGGGGSPMYGGGEEGRLLSADSHMGGYHGLHSPGADAFNHFHGGFEPRGYASNDVRIHRTSSDVSSSSGEGFEGNRLYPLSPIIPSAEEESAASATQKSQQPRPTEFIQAHEPLNDDDITTVNSPSREDSPMLQHNSPLSDSGDSSSGDDQPTSNQQEEASLVLNVPPTSSSDQSRATVEFSRIGSAGYLAPEIRVRGRAVTRKNGGGGKQFADNYDPADNPAHAGKYIID